jgi:SAM-dependent methyltransferase
MATPDMLDLLIKANTKLTSLRSVLEELEFEPVDSCWCGGQCIPWDGPSGLYAKCAQCGCKVARYRLSPDDLDSFYRQYYWYDYQSAHDCPSIEARYENDLIDRIPLYMSWVEQIKKPPARILEIGCGNGRLLLELNKIGYDCTGLEMDPQVTRWVREKTGVPVISEAFPSPSLPQYDLIIAIDVIEHIPDQHSFFKGFSNHLVEDGSILMHIPLVDTDEQAYARASLFNPLSHVIMHTTDSFCSLLLQHGLTARKIGELFNMPCFELKKGIANR